jgi:hypothetical protein
MLFVTNDKSEVSDKKSPNITSCPLCVQDKLRKPKSVMQSHRVQTSIIFLAVMYTIMETNLNTYITVAFYVCCTISNLFINIT